MNSSLDLTTLLSFTLGWRKKTVTLRAFRGFGFCALFFAVFLALWADAVSLQAQTRTEKNSARKLMLELSEEENEAEDDGDFEVDFGANAGFDSDDEKHSGNSKRTSTSKKFSKSSREREAYSGSTAGSKSDGKSRSGNSSKSKTSSKSKNSSKSKTSAAAELGREFEDSDFDEKSRVSGSSSKKSSKSKNASKNSSQKKKDTSRNQTVKKGKKKNEEPEDLRTPEEKERDRMEYFKRTGIWRWPELTPEQHEKAVAKQKEYLEEIKAAFPQTVYYESEHFFYLTDAPKPIALECLKYLEAMFARLCQIFEFPPGSAVWNGKCIVCAFVFQQQFLQFEQKFFSESAQEFSGASGLAHMSSDGNVLISLFYGDISKMEARWKFIGILVHETTHGFMHRYRARQRIPIWLEEGIADSMPVVIVPADRQTFLKQRSGLERMRMTGSVGGLMTAQGHIEVWQYGIASGLVMFLIKQDSHKFKKFLDDIKDGKDWEAALREHYGCSAEELLFHFGRVNRVPRLTF